MGQIIPHSQSGKKFLRYLGLKNEKKLRCFENNWVSLDYLYERAREVLHEWDNILTLDIGTGPEKEIPEYQVFFLLTYSPQRLICVDYELADHPYFTRSKARADMTDSGASDQNGLGLVIVLQDEPETSEGREPIPYAEHIANLMQKMANMQSEIDRLRNLTNLSITLNTPLSEHGTNTATLPLFPHVDSLTPQYFPRNPSLHKTNPTASKQSTNPQQPNFPQNNP
uniref:Uncharacterized protein n=1 Tax=Solanum tuberosum TaxID=4113 RepID=M0ZZK2_SOLTU